MTGIRNDEPADRDVFLPLGGGRHASRRSFLKLVGFGVATASVAGCSRGPVQKVVTWLDAPEGITAGRSYALATTCGACTAGCGVLAWCKDGRPVKLEGNPQHELSRGALCAVGQASLLSLYDSQRFSGPRSGGQQISWERADGEIRAALSAARGKGGKVRLLTGTITSPSTLAWINRFLGGFEDAAHVSYDPLSCSAILDAHELTHGVRALPRYRFDRAGTIASFDADFLGTWISPVEFASAQAAGRDPTRTGGMSRHWQLESRVSMTGDCADERVRIAPWEVGDMLAGLCDLLAKKAARSTKADGRAADAPHQRQLQHLADDLWTARGRSLVIAGTNHTGIQTLVNEANELLGNYGKTLDVTRPSLQKRGSDGALQALIAELEKGQVDVLVVSGVNPAYDLPGSGGISKAIEKAALVLSTAPLEDETSRLAAYVLPEPHYLESWNDGEPTSGLFTLTQPAVPPLRAARTLRETLARWSGETRSDRELLAQHWKTSIHPLVARGARSFESFFHQALHDGGAGAVRTSASRPPAYDAGSVRVPAPGQKPGEGQMVAVLYPKVSMLDGSHAHNPWLQELPDPVSRITWDSYAVLSRGAARVFDVEEGDLLRIVPGGRLPDMELPVHVQPGQHDQVIAIALGYGRLGTDRFTNVGPEWWEGERTVEPGGRVGVNAAPLLRFEQGSMRYEGRAVQVSVKRGRRELASVQDHHSLEVPEHLAPAHGEVRMAARSATLEEFRHDPAHAVHGDHHHPKGELWEEDHVPSGHHWRMVVDLNACTGCSACVIACQAENNIPVVGRDEVKRHREMSWIRIDRYHQGGGDDVEVVHQPMMCQHCDHAPCEAVCPVLATVHSSEGLNQQVYNRCVGTRYCANTCPYKVRRFNWFDYPREDKLQNHALNPDVTVRSRGVMEKCTMCVQRIQEARLGARSRGESLSGTDIQMACQQSCPTRAISFGDMSDAKSTIAKMANGNRAYRVLEETNVRPSVSYLLKVRNKRG